jgi:hypothetical protein
MKLIADLSVYSLLCLRIKKSISLPNLNKTSLYINLNLSSPESIFIEKLALLNISQHNNILNHKHTILDLVLLYTRII